jgi:hypothetical protein
MTTPTFPNPKSNAADINSTFRHDSMGRHEYNQAIDLSHHGLLGPVLPFRLGKPRVRPGATLDARGMVRFFPQRKQQGIH